MRPILAALILVVLLAGCASQLTVPPLAQCPTLPGACPACPVCPKPDAPPVAAKPFEAARWEDLDGWRNEVELALVFHAFLESCSLLQKKDLWRETCDSARALPPGNDQSLRDWFEAQLLPWQLVNPDGSREGLITGYYEPTLRGSRSRSQSYAHPIFGVPADLIDVELGDLHPELRNLRLRGRVDGRKLVPYFSRSEWEKQESQRTDNVLVWADDAIDVFFMQIQGSGQVQLDDGGRIRIGYADQNGHPYRSIGRWLIERGELKAEQASMQGIKAWARAHPQRVQELLNHNPSYVYFRELAVTSAGPPGALGIPLTAGRSIAVDARFTALGAPVWLITSEPNSDRPLARLMLAQDTGGAIRGPVRADFFWGSGDSAGALAGKMRQKGRMWVLLPRGYAPAAPSR